MIWKWQRQQKVDFFVHNVGKEGLPIQRKKGQEREAGHLKKLYCIYCKKDINHAEIREIGGYEVKDFQQEYNLGRFVNGNRIAIRDLMECSYEQCEYNINNKCWNSNWTNNCGHRVKEVDNNA